MINAERKTLADDMDSLYAIMENGYWKERVGDAAIALRESAASLPTLTDALEFLSDDEFRAREKYVDENYAALRKTDFADALTRAFSDGVIWQQERMKVLLQPAAEAHVSVVEPTHQGRPIRYCGLDCDGPHFQGGLPKFVGGEGLTWCPGHAAEANPKCSRCGASLEIVYGGTGKPFYHCGCCGAEGDMPPQPAAEATSCKHGSKRLSRDPEMQP